MLPALILAAGTGTRLDPITRLVAKPAVPLAGRTLIERVIEWLTTAHVTDVVINLHHRPETITGIVGDGSTLGVNVQYSWEPAILGSAGGPRHALPLLGDEFLIVNGDTLVEFGLAPMIERHRESSADVTVAVIPNPRPDHYHGLQLDAEDRVTGFVLRGSGRPSWHFVGVQIARASVFAGLADNVPAETVTGIYRDIVATRLGALRGYRVETPFLDVGTPSDYLDAAVRLARPATNAIEAGAVVDPAARLSESVVWAGASIAAGAGLERSVVTRGVHVPAGFASTAGVLLPSALVRPTDRFEIRGDIAVAPLSQVD
jgi:NDP-sugar pyrophosphorylase family protein